MKKVTMLKELIEQILEAQETRRPIIPNVFRYPVDICLRNGNIILRAFRITEVSEDELKGLTWIEEYTAPREDRDPVYCYFRLDDIASLYCPDLDIAYEDPQIAGW